jgi:hypothetical protein
MFRKFLLSCAALFAATACSPLSARPLVDLSVVDRDSGQWLPQYGGRGDTWVPGVPGHRYAVRMTNTTGERVLVVLSVDGVNAVSGEDADPGQAGYVLGPWESAEIAGWRKSMDDIAQFYFTDLPDSYAARTGRPDNVGVIGIAVFRERRPPTYTPMPPPIYRGDRERREAASRAPSGAADKAAAPASESVVGGYDDSAAQRIGTGHGAREWAPVSNTTFARASSRPEQVREVRYDAPERLAALGILPRPYRQDWRRDDDTPRAFPSGFVPDPPDRDGYRY